MPKRRTEGPTLFGGNAPEQPAKNTRTRALSKYMTFFLQHCRSHPPPETRGVIRQIQRLLDKGISEEQLAIALRNYRDDPFRKESDPRMVKHIRSFFTEAVIKQWQNPVSKVRQGRPVSADVEFLGRLDEHVARPAAQTPPAPTPVVREEEPVEEFVL